MLWCIQLFLIEFSGTIPLGTRTVGCQWLSQISFWIFLQSQASDQLVQRSVPYIRIHRTLGCKTIFHSSLFLSFLHILQTEAQTVSVCTQYICLEAIGRAYLWEKGKVCFTSWKIEIVSPSIAITSLCVVIIKYVSSLSSESLFCTTTHCMCSHLPSPILLPLWDLVARGTDTNTLVIMVLTACKKVLFLWPRNQVPSY